MSHVLHLDVLDPNWDTRVSARESGLLVDLIKYHNGMRDEVKLLNNSNMYFGKPADNMDPYSGCNTIIAAYADKSWHDIVNKNDDTHRLAMMPIILSYSRMQPIELLTDITKATSVRLKCDKSTIKSTHDLMRVIFPYSYPFNLGKRELHLGLTDAVKRLKERNEVLVTEDDIIYLPVFQEDTETVLAINPDSIELIGGLKVVFENGYINVSHLTDMYELRKTVESILGREID